MRRIDTICRDCVFASFDLDDVQDGCALNRLEAFAANGGVLVQEAGEDSTYYRIEGRSCTACHNAEWASHQEDQSADGLIAAAYDRVTPRVLAVVHAGPEDSDAAVEASLASLGAQGIAPAGLALCFSDEYRRAGEWAARLQAATLGFAWKVINGEPPTEAQAGQYDSEYLRMVDEAVRDATAPYYTAARAGFAWPPGYIEAFHRAEQVEMRRVVAVLPAPGTADEGYLTTKLLHDGVYENRGGSVCDKLRGWIDEHGFEGSAATWAELGLAGLEAACES